MDINTSNLELVEILEKHLDKLSDKINALKSFIDAQKLHLKTVEEFLAKRIEISGDDIYKIATDSDEECYHQRSAEERIVLTSNREFFSSERSLLREKINYAKSLIEKYEFKIYCKILIQKDLQRQLAEVKVWIHQTTREYVIEQKLKAMTEYYNKNKCSIGNVIGTISINE